MSDTNLPTTFECLCSNDDAISFAGSGGPDHQHDASPLLRNITAGRDLPDQRVEEITKHYRHCAGVSPINGNNQSRSNCAAITELGQWYDMCQSGCTHNVRRGFNAAAAGLVA